MINTKKLKAKMIECGINVENLSKAIGLNRSTLYRKLSGNADSLSIGEAVKISQTLNLSTEEVTEIFFASYVA